MTKLLYKPVGMVFGLAASLAASLMVKQVWRLTTGNKKTPDPKDPENSWQAVLAGAALEGLVYAVVKAAVERGNAAGVKHLTPDD